MNNHEAAEEKGEKKGMGSKEVENLVADWQEEVKHKDFINRPFLELRRTFHFRVSQNLRQKSIREISI